MKEAKIDDLQLDQHNANKGTKRGLKALDDSLRKFGAGRSILIDKNGRVIAGNKTVERAVDIGMENIIIVESDGSKLVAVQRTDLDLDDDHGSARALAMYDNRVGQLDLDWDVDQFQFVDLDIINNLFTREELEDLAIHFPDQEPQGEPELTGEHIVEIYCDDESLRHFQPVLAEWAKRKNVTINIS